MAASYNTMRSGRYTRAADPAKIRSVTTTPQRNFLAYGVVGHIDNLTDLPEPSPAYVRIQDGQVLVEVTIEPNGDEIVARLGHDGAGAGTGDYIPLEWGCHVVVEFVAGNPQNAVIIARLHNQECFVPHDVAGVQTGAVGGMAEAFVPAPMWRFVKMGVGQLLAIETQAGGDIVIHSAGSVEIAAGPAGAIHLSGRVALGESPVTPPVGATVGPAGTTIPGVPAVPHVPLPKVPGIPAPPATIVPYLGLADGIIRAKDGVQSHIVTDPYFWGWLNVLHSFPLILAWASAAGFAAPPLAIHSEHSGLQGPGSQHTASD
jgi:hypothetical protein